MSAAAIKRKLQVGSKVQLVRHDWPMLKMPGETDEQREAKRAQLFAVRPVAKVQSNGVAFQTGEKVSWLYFKTAKEIRETPSGFQVDLDGSGSFEKVMEYEFRA